MHAENGGAPNVIVKEQALAEGKSARQYHAAHAPTTAEAEAHLPRYRLDEMAGPPYTSFIFCNDAIEKVRESARTGACPRLCGDGRIFVSLLENDVPGFEGGNTSLST